MSQLLVRKLDAELVRKLKSRARAHGISAEEEHRRILSEALTRQVKPKPSLIDYLSRADIAPKIDLPLSRSRDIEIRDTGF